MLGHGYAEGVGAEGCQDGLLAQMRRVQPVSRASGLALVMMPSARSSRASAGCDGRPPWLAPSWQGTGRQPASQACHLSLTTAKCFPAAFKQEVCIPRTCPQHAYRLPSSMHSASPETILLNACLPHSSLQPASPGTFLLNACWLHSSMQSAFPGTTSQLAAPTHLAYRADAAGHTGFAAPCQFSR